MKPRGITAVGGVLLAACSVAPAQLSGPVPIVRGSASAFTPLVATSASVPSCIRPSSASLDRGLHAVALHYPLAPRRQVTVTLDGSGEPVRYTDVRGDLSESDDQSSDRTTIGLYLDQGYAVLSNREGSAPPDMLEVPLDEVLTSPRFGNPKEEMEHVLATCDNAM